MRHRLIVIGPLLAILCSCGEPRHAMPRSPGSVLTMDTRLDSSAAGPTTRSTHRASAVPDDSAKSPKVYRQVFGYRFRITGDFDGNGTRETLQEHFIDIRTGKEANKFYLDSLDELADDPITYVRDNRSVLTCSSRHIHPLLVTSGPSHFGLSMLRNEGDLNGDKSDEISYVKYWGDQSSVNSCRIATYRKGKWIELYSFEICDWQLPALPYVQQSYGLFGVDGSSSTVDNDTVNRQLQESIERFPGFIRKLRSGKIRVNRVSMEGDSTIVVDLRPRARHHYQISRHD